MGASSRGYFGLGPLRNWSAQGWKGSKLLQNILKECKLHIHPDKWPNTYFWKFAALRLHPLFSTNHRIALSDSILPAGGGPDGCAPIFVPAGSKVSTAFNTLHREPSIFGEDVEVFNPDRWNYISPESWEYMLFGHGPRSCAGRHKTLSEASYVIGRLADKFARLESRDNLPWTGEDKLVVKKFNGSRVALYKEWTITYLTSI